LHMIGHDSYTGFDTGKRTANWDSL
jgi:hypothetical protein